MTDYQPQAIRETTPGPYSSDGLQQYSDRERVRMRPRMYIGSTDTDGLHYVADRALEFIASSVIVGHGNRVDVIVNQEGSLFLQHDGRGIPIAHDERLTQTFGREVSVLEGVMTVLSYGAEHKAFGNGGIHTQIGVNFANFLSEWCVIESRLNGRAYRQRYRHGLPEGGVEEIGPTAASGVAIAFLPDAGIFSTTFFDPRRLYSRIEELSRSTPQAQFTFEDRRRHEFPGLDDTPKQIT